MISKKLISVILLALLVSLCFSVTPVFSEDPWDADLEGSTFLRDGDGLIDEVPPPGIIEEDILDPQDDDPGIVTDDGGANDSDVFSGIIFRMSLDLVYQVVRLNLIK